MKPLELKKIRKEKLKLSQEAFANVLDIDRATVIRWERGYWPIPKSAELAIEHLIMTAKRPRKQCRIASKQIDSVVPTFLVTISPVVYADAAEWPNQFSNNQADASE